MVTEKSSLLPKLSLVIWLQSIFQGPAAGIETGMLLSVGVKERKLPVPQALGALTVVFARGPDGEMKTIDCAPTPGVVPWAKSIRYSVLAATT